jgi:D-glycero-D-manno-heptose 1,7-bisphosphate phosphatase
MLDEPTLHAIHRAMETHLHSGGVTVDGWYFCPHHPRAIVPSLRIACGCRKPQPGMLQAAAREHDLDLARSFVVGDKAIDMAVGAAVGATGVLVRTGYGEGELTQHGGSVPHASYVAADLLAAATWIVDRDATRAPVK